MKKILLISISFILLFCLISLIWYVQKPSSKLEPVEERVALDSTVDWKTYKNEKYGIELQYPSDWPTPSEGISPGLGMRYEYTIFFSNKPEMDEQDETGFAIKIYTNEDTMSDIRFTDEMSATADDYESCISNFTKKTVLGVNNYPAQEVYSNQDSCIATSYFYTIQDGEYLYNIVPYPQGGTQYVGYDGKAQTQQYLPEFYTILSTISFTK